MKHFFKLTCLALATLLLNACQEPEYKLPEKENVTHGINSLTAYFLNDNSDDNKFVSQIDHENKVITVVFPYTYPAKTASFLTEENLKKVKVIANLDDNCYIEPAISFMDLTVDNKITVINQRAERTDYIVKGEIRKSAECEVTGFKLLTNNLTGVINEATGVISIVAGGTLEPQLAEIKTSFGATISSAVDPTVTPCDYNSDVNFTVTAQDGKTSKNYTVVKQLPPTVEKGMRPNSGKILWNIKLKETYGLTSPLLMTSMAVLEDCVVLNTRGEDLLVIDAATGEKIRTIELPFKGSTSNFKITGDGKNNILVTGISTEEVVVYRINGVNGTPEEYIKFNAGGKAYGRGISVVGCLDEDAVIIMPMYQDDWYFRRWKVTNGVLNPESELVKIESEHNAGGWVYNCDIVPTDPKNIKGDYFINSYAKIKSTSANDRATVWIDGGNNGSKAVSAFASPNWVRNAGDYAMFNGVGYLVANSVNSFTWGSDDVIYLYDLADNNLDLLAWSSEKHIFGSFANIGEANGNSCGDVALKVSDDGFFMNMYFFFAGGRIVCVQFDCLLM